MRREREDAYQAWLWGEVLLLGLLGASLALFLTYPSLRDTSELPQLRLVLDTAVTLAAGIVAVLTGVRFSVEGRKLDFLLSGGFFVAAFSTFAFGIAPSFGGETVGRSEAWAGMCCKLLGAVLIAAAPFMRGRIMRRRRALLWSTSALAIVTLAVWISARGLDSLPAMERGEDQPVGVIVVLALQAFLSLVALIGFGLRFRREGEDLDRWLGLGASLALFAELHYVFTPVVSNEYVSQGDFLRVLSYASCSRESGGPSASPSSAAPWRKSEPASRGRSTTAWRSTCSRSRRT